MSEVRFVVGLMIGACLAFGAHVIGVQAQSQQPTMYRVGSYARTDSWAGTMTLWWFERDGAECYVIETEHTQGGVGISCLRKVQP